MPLSQAFYKEATERLGQVRPIRSRKMFGGAGIYCNDIFFAILDDDRIYFKVDEQTRAEYEAFGMGPWMLGPDAQIHYRELPDTVWSQPDLLGDWIDRSVEAAKRLKAKSEACAEDSMA